MKYDDASWHAGGDFPETSPEEYGATHIALFLKWCFIKGWRGDIHSGDSQQYVDAVISGEMNATEYFLQHCDGKLTNEDFTVEGNQFAEQYYGDNGRYLDDYVSLFGDKMYVSSETEHDFKMFSNLIEKRYQSGKLTKQPWWKFWA